MSNVVGFALALICLLFGVAGCTTIHVRPMAGMLGTQCVFPTEVFCADVLSEHTCEFVEETTIFWNMQSPSDGRFFVYKGRAHVTDNNASNFMRPNRVVVTLAAVQAHEDVFGVEPQEIAQTLNLVERKTFCRQQAIIIFKLYERDLSDGSMAQVLRHEFGHVLGLPDIRLQGCIMSEATLTTMEEPQSALCDLERNLFKAAYY